MRPDYFIFVPAYNVAKTLVDVLLKIPSSVWAKANVLVLDDGSADGTRGTFEKFSAKLDEEQKSRLSYMRYEKNRGYGTVVKRGIAAGLDSVYRRCGERLEAHHAGTLTPAERLFVEQRQHLTLKRFVLGDNARLSDPGHDTLLIFVMNDHARLERAHWLITSSLPCTAMLYRDIFDPATGLLEVYRQGCTKARAIATLASQCGASRVVAFGDNLNDLDMLRHADVAVAVANAVPEVKAAAHIVIGPNTTDAVPRFIEQMEGLHQSQLP